MGCAECGRARYCNPDNDCCAECEARIAAKIAAKNEAERLERTLPAKNLRPRAGTDGG